MKSISQLAIEFNKTEKQMQSLINKCFFYFLSEEEIKIYLERNYNFSEEMQQEKKMNMLLQLKDKSK